MVSSHNLPIARFIDRHENEQRLDYFRKRTEGGDFIPQPNSNRSGINVAKQQYLQQKEENRMESTNSNNSQPVPPAPPISRTKFKSNWRS